MRKFNSVSLYWFLDYTGGNIKYKLNNNLRQWWIRVHLTTHSFYTSRWNRHLHRRIEKACTDDSNQRRVRYSNDVPCGVWTLFTLPIQLFIYSSFLPFVGTCFSLKNNINDGSDVLLTVAVIPFSYLRFQHASPGKPEEISKADRRYGSWLIKQLGHFVVDIVWE